MRRSDAARAEEGNSAMPDVTPFPKECEHDYKRAGPVVVVINDPLAKEKGGETYNAECSTCGHRAWVHWPEPVYR